METLGYNKNRLLLGGLASLACGIFFLWIITSPEPLSLRGPARLLSTDFGRYVFAPLLMFGCFACAWRFTATGLGHGKAMEVVGGDLVVHTLWGPKRFRSSEIRAAALERVTGQVHLVVRGGKGAVFGEKKARLVLGLTEVAPARAEELAATVRRLGKAPRSGAPSAPAEAEPAEQSDFDADAALARYLARKEASGVSADPMVAQRPVFGRKRV